VSLAWRVDSTADRTLLREFLRSSQVVGFDLDDRPAGDAPDHGISRQSWMKEGEHVEFRIGGNGNLSVAFADVHADRGERGRALLRDGERKDVFQEAAGRDRETVHEGFSPGKPDATVGLGRECKEA